MAYSYRELRRDLATQNTPPQRFWEGQRWQWANAAALRRPAAAPETRRVIFAIPLIARGRAASWDQVQSNLFATLTALRRQTDPRWLAYVCSQDRPETISFDEQVRFLEYSDAAEGYDKGGKMDLIRQTAMRDGPISGYYYVLDADDLIHPGLVEYILGDDNRNGYLVERGYMLDYQNFGLASLQPPDAEYPEATHFYRSCGSSSALWFDRSNGADFAQVIMRRGNHRKVVRNMGYFGFKVAMVPFHAAIYVMNHGDNLRQRRGLMDGKMKHFRINPVRDADRRAEIAETFGFAELFPGHYPVTEGED